MFDVFMCLKFLLNYNFMANTVWMSCDTAETRLGANATLDVLKQKLYLSIQKQDTISWTKPWCYHVSIFIII
jgi:hypothetical protein